MPEDFLRAVPDPDEFDRQLRDLTAGRAEPARFQEPSAAERARLVSVPGKRSRIGWRGARKARRLRRPVNDPRRGARQGPGTGRGAGRGAGASRPAGRARTPRAQRVRSIARTVGVLVAFAALLYALHLLGFGPR